MSDQAAFLSREIHIRRCAEVCAHYIDGFRKHQALAEYHASIAGQASMLVQPTQNGHTTDARTQHKQFSEQCGRIANDAINEFVRAAKSLIAVLEGPDEKPIRPPPKMKGSDDAH